jgi:hypothetical protein
VAYNEIVAQKRHDCAENVVSNSIPACEIFQVGSGANFICQPDIRSQHTVQVDGWRYLRVSRANGELDGKINGLPMWRVVKINMTTLAPKKI